MKIKKSEQSRRQVGYKSASVIAFIIAVVIVSYFEIYYHTWFLKLLGGYVIKIWLLPVILLCFILLRRSLIKDLHIPLKGITVINVLIIFYFIFGLISLLIHEKLYYVGKYSLIMFTPLTLYVIIVDSFRDNKSIEKVFKTLFIAGLLFSLIASVYFINFISSDDWRNDTMQVRYMFTDVENSRSLKDDFSIHGFGYGCFTIRRTLPGTDSPAFGAMLAPLILIGFYYAINSNGLLRIFYYIASFFLFYNLSNTLSRSSFIAFVIGMVPFLWYIRKKIRDVAIIIISLLIITSVNIPMQYRLVQLIGSMIREIGAIQDSRIGEVAISNDGHIDSISESVVNFFKAPLLGNGISNIEEKYKDNRWYAEHSRYLYILSTAGLLTLVPYSAFILGLFIVTRKTLLDKLKTDRSALDIGLVLHPVALLFAVQINNSGMERYYYWIFFGLAAAWIRNSAYENKYATTAN